MQTISAEGAIHWSVEPRFQRSFHMQPQVLGRCRKASLRRAPSALNT